MVGRAQLHHVAVGHQHPVLPDDGPAGLGLPLERLGHLDRLHLTLEQAREGSADRTFEAPLEALQHTHANFPPRHDCPTMVSAPGIPHVQRVGTAGSVTPPG